MLIFGQNLERKISIRLDLLIEEDYAYSVT